MYYGYSDFLITREFHLFEHLLKLSSTLNCLCSSKCTDRRPPGVGRGRGRGDIGTKPGGRGIGRGQDDGGSKGGGGRGRGGIGGKGGIKGMLLA